MNMHTQPTVQSPRMEENRAGQPCYLVEYDEDQWLKYDKAGQDFCFEEWAKKAKPMGAMFIVLRLYPDPLFPATDKTIPYVARSIPVEQDTFNPVTITAKLTASIHTETWNDGDEGVHLKLKIQARQELAMNALASKGCTYEICVRQGSTYEVVERGRL